MNKRIKALILAAILCFVATPFLYIGGQSEGSGMAAIGMIIICVGMAIAPVMHLTRSKEPAEPAADK